MRRLAQVVVLLMAAGACRRQPAAGSWKDVSPHTVSFVTVAPGVKLEVLDWGGRGPNLVFLSGLQDVAHGFDDFAPQFTDHFHVLAITRRGYGASSQTPTGYDVATRVQDLTTALDSLNAGNVILVGHSIAGDELTGFAGAHPERVIGLVYFDAAYDHSVLLPLISAFPAQPPAPVDLASAKAMQAFLLRTSGMLIPEAQIRATSVLDAQGRITGNVTPDSIDLEVIRGAGHPDYAKVKAPALAIDAVVDSAPQLFPQWAKLPDSVKTQARAFTGKITAWGTEQRALFHQGVPSARVVELHGANHYVFYSNRTDVVREMRAFFTGLPAR